MKRTQENSLLTTDSNNKSDSMSVNSDFLIAERTYRFVILTICALLSFANSFQWYTFSSISRDFAKQYELSSIEVLLFTNCYGVINLLMIYPTFYLIEKKNLKFAVLKY
jgi:hypothetical protein